MTVEGPVGWIQEADVEHKCILPRTEGHFVGAIWRCGACGSRYKVVPRATDTRQRVVQLGFEPMDRWPDDEPQDRRD